MRVETFSHTVKVASNSLSNKTVIVVDVLRATTSIICAIKNGAKQVVPAADAGSAVAISSRIGGILAGEKGGFKISGFALGNSPFEFSQENVAGKSVVFSTTNGTVAIKKRFRSAMISSSRARAPTAPFRRTISAPRVPLPTRLRETPLGRSR